MIKNGIYILPIPDKAFFPFMTLKINLNNETYKSDKYNNYLGICTYLEQEDSLISKEQMKAIKVMNNSFCVYGTFCKIISHEIHANYFVINGFQQEQRGSTIRAVALARFKLIAFSKTAPYLEATVEILKDDISNAAEELLLKSATIATLRQLAQQYIDLKGDAENYQPRRHIVNNENNIVKLVFIICGMLKIPLFDQICLLQCDDLNARIQMVTSILQKAIKLGESESSLEDIMKKKLRESQTIKGNNADSIQAGGNFFGKILNDSNFNKNRAENTAQKKDSYESRIKEGNLPKQVQEVATKELERLRRANPNDPERGYIEKYLDTILDLPWNKSTKENDNLEQAEKILNADHAGLDKVKTRVLEFLAVKMLRGNQKGSILCFHGPPGVGKTSLGRSIASALNRKYARIALGGVRDETEIRGHRRTYVGAMSGVILQTLRQCQSNNPVIILDEIDKLSNDRLRGDPQAALLEVLDPAQNQSFTDHYLQLPFDLSNVLFIATANRTDTLHSALRDRLELIQISGYTIEEKTDICQRFLIPKQIVENGLSEALIEIKLEAVLIVIQHYTLEAGVRQLEREMAALCRNVSVQLAKFQLRNKKEQQLVQPNAATNSSQNANTNTNTNAVSDTAAQSQQQNQLKSNQNKQSDNQQQQAFRKIIIDAAMVEEILGPKVHDFDIQNRIINPGVALGLAWTEVGGRVLYVETSKSQGTGKLIITGQLGEVMRESVQMAMGWIKSNFINLGIDYKEVLNFSKQRDEQKHVNNGTIKTDKHQVEEDNEEEEVRVQKKDSHEKNLFDQIDIQVHFPAAATPKDGPSAGITIATALVSLLRNKTIIPDLAMTGEMTLTGLVLPVGGVKEKCIAAYTLGIKNIILPFRNKKDSDDLPAKLKKEVQLHYVQKIEQVLEIAFAEAPSKIVEKSKL